MYDIDSSSTGTFQIFLGMNHIKKVRLFHLDDNIDIAILLRLTPGKRTK
jgi:hypothetical protein